MTTRTGASCLDHALPATRRRGRGTAPAGRERRTNGLRCRSVRLGLTLAELVISMAIMSLLFAATMSASLIATRALPDPTRPSERLLAAQAALVRMTNELQYATTMTATNWDMVEFEVADRGHGAPGPEKVRYQWGGSSGDPLLRQYNGGADTPIANDVHVFNLSYDTVVDAQGKTWTRTVSIMLQLGPDAENQVQTDVTLLNDIP